MYKIFLLSSVLIVSACAGGPNAPRPQNNVNSAMSAAAQQALDSGDVQQSLSLTEQIYKNNPQSADAALDYATALRMAGRETQANLVLKKFSEDPSASARVLNESARISLSSGQYDQALALAKNSVKLYPKNPESMMVLGMSYDAKNELKDAETAYRGALALGPSNNDRAAILNNLALNLTLQEDLNGAYPLIEEALQLDPNKREYKRNRAMIRAMHAQVNHLVE